MCVCTYVQSPKVPLYGGFAQLQKVTRSFVKLPLYSGFVKHPISSGKKIKFAYVLCMCVKKPKGICKASFLWGLYAHAHISVFLSTVT